MISSPPRIEIQQSMRRIPPSNMLPLNLTR
jgi:hypothetical protein